MKLILRRVVYFRESGACLKIAVSEEIFSDLRIHSEEALSKIVYVSINSPNVHKHSHNEVRISTLGSFSSFDYRAHFLGGVVGGNTGER